MSAKFASRVVSGLLCGRDSTEAVELGRGVATAPPVRPAVAADGAASTATRAVRAAHVRLRLLSCSSPRALAFIRLSLVCLCRSHPWTACSRPHLTTTRAVSSPSNPNASSPSCGNFAVPLAQLACPGLRNRQAVGEPACRDTPLRETSYEIRHVGARDGYGRARKL